MFNEKMYEIGLRRKNILVLPFKKIEDNEVLKLNNKTLVTALMKELENLGYMLEKNLYEELLFLNENDIKAIYNFLIKNICELKGNLKYKAFYPNFPKQVEEASDGELFFNSFFHYWSFGKWLPDYTTELREKLKGDYKLDVIYLGKDKEFINIAENLFNSKLVYSNIDKEDLTTIIEHFNVQLNLPNKITNKENLIFITEEYRKNGLDLSNLFKTATDILRYSIALQNGDISLTESHFFQAINRPTRRFLLNLLNNINEPLEDMYRHRNKWLRLAEKLHPYDYREKYEKAFENICYLRGNTKYKEGFNHYVHKYLENKDFDQLCCHLSKRPSEFARRLNEALQQADDNDKELILNSFENVCGSVSSNVLISVYNFFNNINNLTNRLFILKGLKIRTYAINNKTHLEEKYINRVLEICKNGLLENFKNKSKLGKVFIDENIKNINIPNQNRTVSSSFKTLPKGSRIKLDDDKDIVRIFCYWKNQSDKRIDVDLSAIMFKDGIKNREYISYTRLRGDNENLKQGKYYAVHSGDITDAPNGASEYIDMSINEMLNCGFRYVMVNLNMYSGTPFSEMETCGAGFMQRQDKESGDIYEPTTVKSHFKVQAEGRISCPFILDLKNREMIWIDINLQGRISGNAVENNVDKQSLILENILQKNDMTLYDLIELNGKSRAELIKTGDVLVKGQLNEEIYNSDVIYVSDKDLLLSELGKKISEEEIKNKDIVTIYDIDLLLGDLM